MVPQKDYLTSTIITNDKIVVSPPAPRCSSFMMMLFWKYGFRLKWKRILKPSLLFLKDSI